MVVEPTPAIIGTAFNSAGHLGQWRWCLDKTGARDTLHLPHHWKRIVEIFHDMSAIDEVEGLVVERQALALDIDPMEPAPGDVKPGPRIAIDQIGRSCKRALGRANLKDPRPLRQAVIKPSHNLIKANIRFFQKINIVEIHHSVIPHECR